MGICSFSPSYLSNKTQEVHEFGFIPAGNLDIDEENFPTYRIKNPISEKYLVLVPGIDSEHHKPKFTGNRDAADTWCIVPYREIVKWKAFDAEYDPFYENAYWIFSSEQ